MSRTIPNCGGLISRFQALVGTSFGSIRHVPRQGFVVFAPAVCAPGHQTEYVISLTPTVESHSPLLVLVQCLARIIWSMVSLQPTPPTVFLSPFSSTHTSTGSTSPNLQYPRQATTSISRPLFSTPPASCSDAYIRPCTLLPTVPLGSSWVPPSGLSSTFTWDKSMPPLLAAVG